MESALLNICKPLGPEQKESCDRLAALRPTSSGLTHQSKCHVKLRHKIIITLKYEPNVDFLRVRSERLLSQFLSLKFGNDRAKFVW